MGGLLIPEVIYAQEDFEMLSQQLRDKEMEIHFKDYSGDSTDRKNFLKIAKNISAIS